MKKFVFFISLVLISGLVLAGCQVWVGGAQSPPQDMSMITETPEFGEVIAEKDPFVMATVTPTMESVEINPILIKITECQDQFCQVHWPGLLARPIGSSDRFTIDLTYPYASTNNGTLDPHHGVEFPNSHGTEVLAAGDGEVVFAGTDDLTVLGPFTGFYGNVVIIRHPSLYDGRDLFTLYAHLSEIHIAQGALVSMGDRIGEVGASGAADGSHLHFEVRLDINDYNHTTNPVLWFAPVSQFESEDTGSLAGLILDRYGNPILEHNLTLERLAEDGSVEKHYYFDTYTLAGLNSHPELGEIFVLPDIPAGEYRLAFVYGKLHEVFFTLDPQSLGFINLQID